MKRPLLTVLGVFLLGELTGQLMEKGIIYCYGTTGILAGILWGSSKRITAEGKERSNRQIAKKKLRFCLLLLFLFGLGFLWNYGVRQQALTKEAGLEEASLTGQSIGVEGIVISASEYSVILDAGDTKLKVISDVSPDLSPGDKACFSGTVERIPEATNPGAFDTREYMESEGVHWQMSAEKLSGYREGEDGVRSFLYHVKESGKEKLMALLPEKEAGILSAMLLGDKSDLDPEIKELYRRNGIAHVLSISGLHVSLIGAAVLFLLGKLKFSKRAASILTILILLFYGMLTGFPPATLRAVLMITSVSLAGVFRRVSDLPTAAGGALFLILILQPYRVTSAGMLMSFLAVAGIYTGGLVYRGIFGRERFLFLPLRLRSPFKKLTGTLLCGFILQVFLLPVLLRDYYAFSPYSTLLNLIVVPLLTVAIAGGALGLFLSFLPGFLPAAQVVIQPCRWILGFYEWLCRRMTQVPGHEIITGHIDTVEMMIMIAIILLIFCLLYRRLNRRRNIRADRKENGKKTGKRYLPEYLAVLLVSGLLLFVMAGYATLKNRLQGRIVFLDVGQGDGCIVHTGDGTNMLFDCGSSSVENVGTKTLIPALRYYGITYIDAVFISHTDEDHVNGIQELLESGESYGITVACVVFASGTEMDENGEKLLLAAGKCNAEIHFLGQGDSFCRGSTEVRILLPGAGETGSGNDHSLAAKLSTPGCCVYFTGDLGAERERELAAYIRQNKPGDEELQILKVAHHGSGFSSDQTFLQTLECSVAVISCGRKNRYGHPHKETLERLESCGYRIYRTDKNGAVIIRLR